jgi:hypothetical protein
VVIAVLRHNAPPAPPTSAQKLSQDGFCSTIDRFRSSYFAADDAHANEAALSEIRHDRKDALASLIADGSWATNWTGAVDSIETNREGAANVSVRICGDAPNAAALETDERVPRESPLYSNLMGLKHGQQVTFSGKFVVGQRYVDWAEESSITEAGSMRTPEFGFTLNAISAGEAR